MTINKEKLKTFLSSIQFLTLVTADCSNIELLYPISGLLTKGLAKKARR